MKNENRKRYGGRREKAVGKRPGSGRRHSRKKHGIGYAVLVVFAVVLAGGGYKTMHVPEREDQQIRESTIASGEMQVTFLDVGQGDCTIIRTEGHNMVIDAGNNSQGSVVVDWLRENEVTELDYLVLTHPDADHIGGADDVLRAMEVDTVIMPDVENDTITYEEVITLIEEQEIPVEFPEVGKQYTLGDAGFTILCPRQEDVSKNDLNDSSVGMKLVHGTNAFVLCGDAEAGSEEHMTETFGDSLEADVLKCGHHGSSTATTDSFLKAVNPTWAVISCGADNAYGHPHQEVLTKLEEDDVQVYRTDLLGTITAVSDGEEITWTQK